MPSNSLMATNAFELGEFPHHAMRLSDIVDRLMSQNMFAPFASMMGNEVPSLAVDIDETDNAYILRASLPGIRPDNVQIEVRGSTVMIRGEIMEEHGMDGQPQGMQSQGGQFQGTPGQGTQSGSQNMTGQGQGSQNMAGQGQMSGQSQMGQRSQSLMHERYHGMVQRIITLPLAVESSKADATFQNGVLKLVLPKKEQAQVQRITIKAGV